MVLDTFQEMNALYLINTAKITKTTKTIKTAKQLKSAVNGCSWQNT